jgi:hypothetical protein
VDDFSRASPNVVVYDASYDSYIQLRDVVTQIAKLLQGVLLQEDCSAAQVLFDPFRFPFADFAQFCIILWGFSPVQKFNISTFRRVRRPASSCVQAELSKRRAELDRRERQLEAIQWGQPVAGNRPRATF